MFFMDTASLEYLNKSNGWEVGVSPNVVVVDVGKAKTLTTSTAQDGIYGGTGSSRIKNRPDQSLNIGMENRGEAGA
jgi:hypothetical protein